MQFTSYLVLAQAIDNKTTYFEWMLSSLGTFSSLLVFFSAGLMFIGACYLVRTRRPASVLASSLVFLPLPFMISACGWISETIPSLLTIASTPELTVTRAGVAGGIAGSLIRLLVAIVITGPTFFVLAFGLLARTMRPPTNSAAKSSTNVVSPVSPRESITGGVIPAT